MEQIILTDDQKNMIEGWIVQNVNENCIPRDVTSDGGLVYNLVHLLWEDPQHYTHEPRQDKEIERLRKKWIFSWGKA